MEYSIGGRVISSPAVVNGVVYVGSEDNNLYTINATTGTFVWSYPIENRVISSPAVVNGVVDVGSNDNNLYTINATTGAKLWNYTTGSVVDSSPAVANGVVYVGSYDGNVYALGNSTTSITAAASTTVVAVNKPFTINGTLSGSTTGTAGATIQLQRNVSGTWQNLTGKWNTTTSTGAYSISTSEPAAGTYQYRTYYAGNATSTNATSNVVKVNVIAPATAAGNLLLNTHLVSTTTGSPPKMVTTYTFSGQLMTTSWKPVANAAITLQSSADRVHWSAFASPVTTNAQGAYTFKGTLKPGSYYFRTYFAGTSSTGPTASRIVKVVLSLNGSSSVSTVVA